MRLEVHVALGYVDYKKKVLRKEKGMILPSTIKLKVERMARHIGNGRLGREILEFLRTEQNRHLLATAANEGVPPASAISGLLVSRFGLENLQEVNTRQFIGWAVRSVLDEMEFVPASKGARLRDDPLFKVAATYKRAPRPIPLETLTLLARLLDALTPTELRSAKEYIDQKLERTNGGKV